MENKKKRENLENGHYWYPWRFKDGGGSQFESSGFLQLIFFTWIYPVVKKGLQKVLELEDLGKIPDQLCSDVLLRKLNRIVDKERRKLDDFKKISLFKIYLLYLGKRLACSFAMNIFGISSEFVTIMMLRRFIHILESEKRDYVDGLVTIFVMLLTFSLRTLNRNVGHFLNYRAGLFGKAAFTALIYQKVLALKNTGTKSVGELVNLCANDTTRIFEATIYLVNLICLPFVILLYLVYLLHIFGPACLVGCGILMVNIPIQVLSGKLFAYLRGKATIYSDKRIKMITEAFTFVKFIKMYVWEKPFANIIFSFRENERRQIQKMAFAQGFTFTIGYIIGGLAPLATIMTAVYKGDQLTIPETLTLLSIFKLLSFYSTVGPMGMKTMAEMIVSLRRIKSLLIMEEHVKIKQSPDNTTVVDIVEVSFTWKESKEAEENVESNCQDADVKFLPNKEKKSPVEYFSLSDISLSLKQGQLVGICGPVGCGKSSLIQAMLGEMTKLKGSCHVTDSVAYVPQQAWILNATIRDNILFGNDYDDNLYKDVCYCSALNKDFESMPSADLTEIGERGINLSGGQKQRISLARALYSQKALYLLDDPLSAVDSHVGMHIFSKLIKGGLANKAVILVTHQLQYLEECDYIIYMENGRINEEGTYNALMRKGGKVTLNMHNFHSTSTKCITEKRTIERSGTQHGSTSDENNFMEMSEEYEKSVIRKGMLIKKEEKEEGAVSLKTYMDFCSFAGGFIPVSLTFLIIFGSVAFDLFNQYWLSFWIDENNKSTNNTNISANSDKGDLMTEDTFIHVYYGTGMGILVTTTLSTILTVHLLLRGSTQLHNSVFTVIFKAPMSFFDSTPVGRIISRLAKDVDEIDNYLPLLLENGLRFAANILGNLLFVVVVIPFMLIAMVPMLLLLFALNIGFRKVVRETKRIDSVTRSFVYSYLACTVQGITSVKAYKKEYHFKKTFEGYLNDNTLSVYCFLATTRWFSTYTDICCMLVFVATCIVVFVIGDVVSPSLAGLCVLQSFNLIGHIPFMYRLLADIEGKFTSVERLNHYMKTLKPEDDFHLKNELIKDWPVDGSISFENVQFRYRENLPLVLQDVSFSIEHKQKVGFVGRTGAGKSSILVALYRLVNVEQGSITIAGVNTEGIGLSELRSALTIIPQDPVLFVGSIRYNLDPFQHYTDEELWDALEKAHIKELVGSSEGKLETKVVENGANFSVGERQLICLARALLRKKQILILDEATASIDSETDQKIQSTIQNYFQNCTVLTIAHRLNTVMHCDKILVLEQGKVMEYDSPENLLHSGASYFHRMVVAASLSSRQIGNGREQEKRGDGKEESWNVNVKDQYQRSGLLNA